MLPADGNNARPSGSAGGAAPRRLPPTRAHFPLAHRGRRGRTFGQAIPAVHFPSLTLMPRLRKFRRKSRLAWRRDAAELQRSLRASARGFRRPQQPETEVVVAGVGHHATGNPGPAGLVDVVPAAAPIHPVRARPGARRVRQPSPIQSKWVSILRLSNPASRAIYLGFPSHRFRLSVSKSGPQEAGAKTFQSRDRRRVSHPPTCLSAP